MRKDCGGIYPKQLKDNTLKVIKTKKSPGANQTKKKVI